MGHVQYRVALVTYLDILGFKGLINRKKAGDISRLIRIVKEAVRPARFKTPLPEIPDDQYINFSDLSLIVTPLEDATDSPPASQLFSLLLHLVRAQSTLIFDEGILLRGAITIGQVVKSWGQFFGPAVVRAYELEQRANHPRIILDEQIFTALRGVPGVWLHGEETDMRSIRQLIRKHNDRKLFVDYLGAVQGELGDPSAYTDCLKTHRKVINNGLKEFSKSRSKLHRSIHAKYKWLDSYHNSTVARLNIR